MALPEHEHTCHQQTAIATLLENAKTNNNTTNKLTEKLEVVLLALNRNKEDRLLRDSDFKTMFTKLETILSAESKSRCDLAAGQKQLDDKINIINSRVTNIEANTNTLNNDMIETKSIFKTTVSEFGTRIGKLERLSIFVYALGTIIIGIVIGILYSYALRDTIFKNNSNDIKLTPRNNPIMDIGH